MNERMRKLRKKKVVHESLEGKKGIYHKSEGYYVETIGFWLRFLSKHFTPCKKCQRKLLDLFDLKKGNELHLGNNNEPLIELYHRYDLDDQSWKTIEKRVATPEEKTRLKHEWYY